MNARLRKKVAARPVVSNSKYVDAYGDRYARRRYVGKDKKLHFCRVADLSVPDPMSDVAGGDVMGDVSNDFRLKDVRDGCPFCTGDVEQNASEPDVMKRWRIY